MSPPTTFLRRRSDIRDTALWSQFGYHNRKLRELIRRLIEQSSLQPGATVLDYGCADAPYRSELPADCSYIGADLPGNESAQVVLRPDGTVSIDDAIVDLVLSTQVLEHVDDPNRYVTECYRMLRPGGRLILTTHGIMYYHRDPEDHWRWTVTGLQKVVRSAGFEVVQMHGMMGLAAAALQLFQDGTIGYVPRVLRPVYALIMQSAIAFFDRFYSEASRVNNGLILAVVAAKPAT